MATDLKVARTVVMAVLVRALFVGRLAWVLKQLVCLLRATGLMLIVRTCFLLSVWPYESSWVVC